MKSLLKLTFVDLKLSARNYISVFFTLAFPLLMLFLFGGIYGNQPAAIFGGHGSVDVTVPGYIAALIIGTTAFLSLPMDLAAQRQQGVLRRMRATPLPPAWVLISKLVTNLLLSLLGMGLQVAAGAIFFHAYLPENGLAVLLGILLSSLSLYSLGFALASLVRTVNSVRAVSFAVFYPMMFLSGGTIPGALLPETVHTLSKVMPMTYSVNLIQSLWFGNGWDLTAVLALLGFLVLGVLVSVKLFRWE
jgi:ABC-2 type transport system permease protein